MFGKSIKLHKLVAVALLIAVLGGEVAIGFAVPRQANAQTETSVVQRVISILGSVVANKTVLDVPRLTKEKILNRICISNKL